VAHDFNNLLTVILGNDRFLLNQLSTVDPLRAYAEEVMRAAERAAALTRQMLALSRREVIQPQLLDINEAIRQSEKLMRRLMGEGVEVVYRLGAGAGRVRMDPSQLDQVLLNLLINARDAMANEGKVVVETERVELGEDYARMHFGVRAGPYSLMSVSDTGAGIDDETKRHIFEPFFTTKAVDQGTGMGLATVYGIVKQNGGDIWVNSEVGVGSTFKVYLPRIEAGSEANHAQAGAGESSGGSEAVLVVEDESGVRDVVRRVLQMAGYRVLEAEGPKEALEIRRKLEGEIHLLLTDVVMPHMGAAASTAATSAMSLWTLWSGLGRA
jgi:signal transduction histidine kinase